MRRVLTPSPMADHDPHRGRNPLVRPLLARRARLAAAQPEGARGGQGQPARPARRRRRHQRPTTARCWCRCKFLEHARFRLLDPRRPSQGAGQGKGQAGRRAAAGRSDEGTEPGEGGGTGNGEIQFVLELKVDEIVDWLWEELKLPDLKPKRSDARWTSPTTCARAGTSAARARGSTAADHEGSDQAPLDPGRPGRHHQRRPALPPARASAPRPATNAAVIFALDVSGSMDEARAPARQEVLLLRAAGHPPPVRQGRDRCSSPTPPRPGSSTRASSSRPGQRRHRGLERVHARAGRSCSERYDPRRYNAYLFYASDGENAAEDREPRRGRAARAGEPLNYAGYVETGGVATFRPRETAAGRAVPRAAGARRCRSA